MASPIRRFGATEGGNLILKLRHHCLQRGADTKADREVTRPVHVGHIGRPIVALSLQEAPIEHELRVDQVGKSVKRRPPPKQDTCHFQMKEDAYQLGILPNSQRLSDLILWRGHCRAARFIKLNHSINRNHHHQ